MTDKKGKVSELLDPELCADLVQMSAHHDIAQGEADNDKWNIAARVNEDWDEHKTLFETKEHYFAECSRVINLNRKKKYFSESGATLRRYCELQATYANLAPKAELFLDVLSIDHLFKAKILYNGEKVDSPVLALAKAASEGWSADEMRDWYDPPNPQPGTPKKDYEGILKRWLGWRRWADDKKARFTAWAEAGKEFFK